jgi:NAD+ synthase (glutamine-hydrolysing)
MHGFYRIASAVPSIKVADTDFNSKNIIKCIKKANKNKAVFVVFPELSITSYTCGDLFFQSTLIESALSALDNILIETKTLKIISIIGLPITYNNSIYNCAAIIQQGKILGIVPKSNLPNYREFYEERWFTACTEMFTTNQIEVSNNLIPFGTNLIFKYNNEFKFSAEICEDLWSVIPPSSYHTMAGATVIANLSASNELIGKAEYRTALVKNQSARCMCGYIYASSGIHESSADVLYGGHMISAENGRLINSSKRFQRDNIINYSDIDCQKLLSLRMTESSMEKNYQTQKANNPNLKYTEVKITEINEQIEPNIFIDPQPFVPSNKDEQNLRCTEIFNIQANALTKRLEHTKTEKSIIGISGGLDSTLALLVITEAHKILNKSPHDIIAITMPGFGTTDRTYLNALAMCKQCNTELREINIKNICEEQFKLLNIDTNIKNTAYENVQARQRTKILMNTANNENGIVIGTGDLSEIALGWSTYNGDHMSMYAVNCGVPKTLIRYLIEWYANKSNNRLKDILIDIINTPVSPELLPPDKQGGIAQKTEDIIGPYELHDFFLYHTIKYGATPEKILYIACKAFHNKYDQTFINKYLTLFIKRFFTQQFKRNCIPDGPKVGTIALSPRGDWRMPPEASYANWLGRI